MEQLALRGRTAARAILAVIVVGWLFSDVVRSAVPMIVPLAALALVELEVALGAVRERGTQSVNRPAPGEEDADLGYGDLVEDELGVRLVPPPARAQRRWRDRWPLLVGAGAAAAIVAVGVRDDRAASWEALSPAAREATRLRLQSEAAQIAGKPVRLECSDEVGFAGIRSDALGVAYPLRGTTYLRGSVCRDLHDVLESGSVHGDRHAESIVVLAHEAVHLGGERSESVTECLGLQHGVGLARRLGVPTDTAARVMRGRYLTDLADRSLIRLEYRLPAGCRDGGPLDLDPTSSRFP